MASRIIRCEAPGCKNKTQYRSREWTRNWMMVWVEGKENNGRLFDVCSDTCKDAVKNASSYPEKEKQTKTKKRITKTVKRTSNKTKARI